jgi:nucleotide-binding universal stress UspA family protein
MLRVTPYRSIAVAATFSPRFHDVLAEANRVCARFGAKLNMIHVGKHDAATARKFADAVTKLKLPADSTVHYEEGDPANSILAAAKKLNVDLLVAGALEKEAVHRQFLGNVARRLAREAPCSVLLFTKPAIDPQPLRRIVFLAEFSEQAQRAFRRTLQLAELENCERLYVVRTYTSFDKARARRQNKSGGDSNRTLQQEELALQEFVLAEGETKIPIETRCIRGNTGFASSNFVQAVEANLLVVPWEKKLSASNSWVTEVIPCNLWIIR